jgi:hypothetical protein
MSRFLKAARIVLATLREIFDEAAYERFLRRTHVISSKSAYADFWRERESSQARPPRCC